MERDLLLHGANATLGNTIRQEGGVDRVFQVTLQLSDPSNSFGRIQGNELHGVIHRSPALERGRALALCYPQTPRGVSTFRSLQCGPTSLGEEGLGLGQRCELATVDQLLGQRDRLGGLLSRSLEIGNPVVNDPHPA